MPAFPPLAPVRIGYGLKAHEQEIHHGWIWGQGKGIKSRIPEETEAEFNETIEYARKLKFAKIHVFPYSEREGTKAADMPQMDMSIRKSRAKRLIEVSDELASEFASSMTGKEIEILIEKIEEKDGKTIAEGYTGNYVRAFAEVEKNMFSRGDIVKGTAVRAENENIFVIFGWFFVLIEQFFADLLRIVFQMWTLNDIWCIIIWLEMCNFNQKWNSFYGGH